jgi:Carboxypeptidase regulatory-like domain
MTTRRRRKRKKRRTGVSALAPRMLGRHSLTKRIICLAALALYAFWSSAQVQPPIAGHDAGTTRSIEGIVRDASGNAITGAIVLLKNTRTLQVTSYIAQSNGAYQFYGLSTETNYQVRAQANGLTSKTKNVSVFNSHKVVKIDLKVNKKLKT